MEDYKIEMQKRKLCKGNLGRVSQTVKHIKTSTGFEWLLPEGYVLVKNHIENPNILRNKYGKKLRLKKKERLEFRRKLHGKNNT